MTLFGPLAPPVSVSETPGDPGAARPHAALVARAVRWLRGAHRCKVVFAEMAGPSAYIPDAIGWAHGGFSILVECKVSRGDFFADRAKPIHRNPDGYPGEERWFLTPPALVRPDEVPAGWFLAEAHPAGVRIITHPETQPPFDQHPEHAKNPGLWCRLHNRERQAHGVPFLVSAVRRHQLGVEWQDADARFARMMR